MSEEKQEKPRILAVDDSRVMRRAMSRVLSKDYHVIEVENGEDAWTVLLNDDLIQVVFTDLSMPYLDGYGLLERMRASDDARIRELPVIIITGKEDDDDAKQEALDKGANDFITKPFDSVQLQARAKAHVTFKQTSKKLSETSDKLERQATVDETTGLGGQRYFCKVGDEILAYAVRHQSPFVLIRMDIDNFNDLFIKHGKKIMDTVLKTIGEKFDTRVRQEDTVARIGVSKFGFILRETSLENAHTLIDRMREEVQGMAFKVPPNGDLLKLTMSAGIYEPDLEAKQEFKDVIAQAEKYLAEAAGENGNRVVSHSDNKLAAKPEYEDVNILELLEQLKQNKPDALAPKIDAILHHIQPLLKFLAENARDKFQAVLQQISKK